MWLCCFVILIYSKSKAVYSYWNWLTLVDFLVVLSYRAMDGTMEIELVVPVDLFFLHLFADQNVKQETVKVFLSLRFSRAISFHDKKKTFSMKCVKENQILGFEPTIYGLTVHCLNRKVTETYALVVINKVFKTRCKFVCVLKSTTNLDRKFHTNTIKR